MWFFSKIFRRNSAETPSSSAPENTPKPEKKVVLKKNNDAKKKLETRSFRDVTGEHLAVRRDMRDSRGRLPYDPSNTRWASDEVKQELSRKWASRAGVRDDDVRNKIGHTDGSYTDSVKKFQKENNLDDDGIVGPKTLRKLYKNREEKPAPQPAKPEEKPAEAPKVEKPAQKKEEKKPENDGNTKKWTLEKLRKKYKLEWPFGENLPWDTWKKPEVYSFKAEDGNEYYYDNTDGILRNDRGKEVDPDTLKVKEKKPEAPKKDEQPQKEKKSEEKTEKPTSDDKNRKPPRDLLPEERELVKPENQARYLELINKPNKTQAEENEMMGYINPGIIERQKKNKAEARKPSEEPKPGKILYWKSGDSKSVSGVITKVEWDIIHYEYRWENGTQHHTVKKSELEKNYVIGGDEYMSDEERKRYGKSPESRPEHPKTNTFKDNGDWSYEVKAPDGNWFRSFLIGPGKTIGNIKITEVIKDPFGNKNNDVIFFENLHDHNHGSMRLSDLLWWWIKETQ